MDLLPFGLFGGFSVLVFVLPFGLIAAAIVWSVKARQKRIRLTQEWCARNGWAFVGDDRTLHRRWRGSPFNVGDSRASTEVVTGRFEGRPAMSFAYQYSTGSGKNRSTSYFHVVVVALPVPLPMLQLTNDGFGARLAKSFGGQDLQFESEQFNEAWRVESSDPRIAHAILHPRLMERLLWPDARVMAMRIEGSDLLCWVGGRQRLEAIGAYGTVLNDVVESIPRWVWQEHGYDPVNV